MGEPLPLGWRRGSREARETSSFNEAPWALRHCKSTKAGHQNAHISHMLSQDTHATHGWPPRRHQPRVGCTRLLDTSSRGSPAPPPRWVLVPTDDARTVVNASPLLPPRSPPHGLPGPVVYTTAQALENTHHLCSLDACWALLLFSPSFLSPPSIANPPLFFFSSRHSPKKKENFATRVPTSARRPSRPSTPRCSRCTGVQWVQTQSSSSPTHESPTPNPHPI